MTKRRRGSRTARLHPPPARPHRPFEELVDEALATIPMPFAAALDEVAIVIADEPTADQLRDEDPTRTMRCTACTKACRAPSGAPTGPPSRTGSRCSAWRSRRTSPIRRTWPTRSGSPSIHELAHHLGIDDDRLHALGVG